MKYAIFYFSPCGGTKSVADIISKELGDAPMQELTTPSTLNDPETHKHLALSYTLICHTSIHKNTMP